MNKAFPGTAAHHGPRRYEPAMLEYEGTGVLGGDRLTPEERADRRQQRLKRFPELCRNCEAAAEDWLAGFEDRCTCCGLPVVPLR